MYDHILHGAVLLHNKVFHWRCDPLLSLVEDPNDLKFQFERTDLHLRNLLASLGLRLNMTLEHGFDEGAF